MQRFADVVGPWYHPTFTTTRIVAYSMAAGLLNIAYSAIVLLVAVAGLLFVFTTGEDGKNWLGLAATVLVAVFLIAMLGDIIAPA